MFKNNWQLISVIRVRCHCATGRDSIGCKNVDRKQMKFPKYGQMQSAILSMEIVTKSNATFMTKALNLEFMDVIPEARLSIE